MRFEFFVEPSVTYRRLRNAGSHVTQTRSPEMLRKALDVDHPHRNTLASEFGWPDDINWSSPCVLLRQPDPAIPDRRNPRDNRSPLWLMGPSRDHDDP